VEAGLMKIFYSATAIRSWTYEKIIM